MRFAFPASMLGSTATITSTGAIDPAYPLTNLLDGLPTEVTRWTTNALTRVVLAFPAPVTIQGMLLVMHTFAAGAVLKVEAHTSDSWGAPDFSQDVTVPAWPDHLPANVLADFTGTALATTGFAYVSLLIPAQTANHAIGELLWIAEWERVVIGGTTERRLPRADIRRVNVNTTSHGVEHVVERGVRQRRVLPLFQSVSAADRALLVSLIRKAGANKGFPVVIEVVGSSGATETLESLYVRFHPEWINQVNESLLLVEAQDIQLDLLEIQRGKPL